VNLSSHPVKEGELLRLPDLKTDKLTLAADEETTIAHQQGDELWLRLQAAAASSVTGPGHHRDRTPQQIAIARLDR
jgi:hypothetical protein